MRKLFTTLILVFGLIVASCSQTVPKPKLKSLVLPKIDSALLKKCPLPVKLPERALTQAEVEKLWAKDRGNFILCAKRHGLLGDAIKYRDAILEKSINKSQ